MPTSPRRSRAPRVEVDRTDGTVVISVRGHLDRATGASLLDAARDAAADDVARVDVDLQALESFTSDGAAALGSCREVCGDLADGLHFRTGPGPGAAALLEGCANSGTP
jgi:anti-anti-sigma regulatory factor